MKMSGKRWFRTLLVAWALVLISSPAWCEEKSPTEDILATVNGSVITMDFYNWAMKSTMEQISKMGRKIPDEQLLEIKERILEELINVQLVYQESQKKGIKIDEAAIDKDFQEMTKKQFPSEAEFKEALSKQGVTEEVLKAHLEQRLTIEKFIQKEFPEEIAVSEEETKAFYDKNAQWFNKPERVRASHILIKVDPNADKAKKAEARKKIEDIQQKLKKGEDFASLAKELSQCPSSAKGGDLDYFQRGTMVKPFEDAAFTLKPGETSDIVETQFGYHLIKVFDKQSASTVPYKEVEDNLKLHLGHEKSQKEMQKYAEKLKETAKVERFLAKLR